MKLTAPILALLLLAGSQDERDSQKEIVITGPPAILVDGKARFHAAFPTPPRDAKIVWHFSDLPGYVETDPPMHPHKRTIEGAGGILMKVGKTTGEGRFTVSIVRNKRRVMQTTFKFLVCEPVVVNVRLRPVQNHKGGTQGGGLLRFAGNWHLLSAPVNAVHAQAGLRIRIQVGDTLKVPDSWFDKDGVFHPITRNYQKKDQSKTLKAMWKHNRPGAVDVYLVRDCFWFERLSRGIHGRWIEHTLKGVGLEGQGAVIDDSGDAATLAHELGHILGLEDLKDKKYSHRLMFSVRKYRSGYQITYDEMKTMRNRASKLRIEHTRDR